jgi:hypothetical protein
VAVVGVYDVTEASSWERVKERVVGKLQIMPEPPRVLVLIGNKVGGLGGCSTRVSAVDTIPDLRTELASVPSCSFHCPPRALVGMRRGASDE